MTPLGREIAETIGTEGPMTVERYMALCLSHPAYGYYATRDPFGRGGDFITAPEISQMFGELIGLWAAEVWAQMGAPERFSLIELGPGRGTLMADMLRAAKAAPGFLQAVEAVLVETSPTLAEIQADRLSRTGVVRRWVRSVEDALGVERHPGRSEAESRDRHPDVAALTSPQGGEVDDAQASTGEGAPPFPEMARPPHPALRADLSPPGRGDRPAPFPKNDPGSAADAAVRDDAARSPALPVIVVANEFFDALPIRQFVRTHDGWRERLVGLDGDGRLAFGLSSAPPDLVLPDAPEGSVREVCPQALDILTILARHLAAHGGAMLAIDYGYAQGAGDTLQAMKAHAFADPLTSPGEADLTAHVDFGALASAARAAGAAAMRLIDQADLLERLGLGLRAEALSRGSPTGRGQIFAAARRLTDRSPRGMGALFKALAVCDPRQPAPPAFEPILPRG